MEQCYHVVWEIDIFAQTPKEAAEKAWDHMRYPDSTANVFEVFDQDGSKTHVDLEEQAP